MKKIIILGASDGLGKAIADLCVKKEVEVINISRTPCNISGVINIACDLSKEENINDAVNIIKEKYDDFSAIINCAAIVGREKINEITYLKFERAFKINTIAPLYFISSLFDNIVKNEADILNIGTTADLKAGFNDQLAYTSTKYGLRGGSYNIGLELVNTKSRMIYIHCGGMNTQMHEKDYRKKIEDPSEWMDPNDVANIVLYLLKLPKQIEITDITINRKKRRLA
ncbi:MAG: SDR family NAD(P)-dependent oxidoreductase [Patescibacteria group bacterium]|nr:SDR family NAD(P)-dependent oxidoreductase [Patescibacteria group bacterium]MDD5121257.1 SDR family NAD(P)-dependent oxidoreductase [Patescibacteria group bacterium]MDD5222165.1 SDR family NAD(P)-dependent oxidoreductase [Patescibacteria group bacterium]MDD5395824.1 SDR family NAD(P)-dependent oxidoreductase [Patescibacteria group bacterium]